MNIVLLQTRLPLDEINQLLNEFPQYLFLSLSENSYSSMEDEFWARLEIVYGGCLRENELISAPQLRWVHVPEENLSRLCLEKIEEQGNVIITGVKDEAIIQTSEFVISAIASYAKLLPYWLQTGLNQKTLWSSKMRSAMLNLEGLELLLVGVSPYTTAIAKQAAAMGMRVYGAAPKATFLANCRQVIPFTQMTQFLPHMDAVCLCLPASKEWAGFFGKKQLNAMKDDSFLLSLSSAAIFDEKELIQAVKRGKIRQVIIDASYLLPPKASSALWATPGIFITPEISNKPRSGNKEAFRLFKYNMRQYLHGNFSHMRNIIDKQQLMKLR